MQAYFDRPVVLAAWLALAVFALWLRTRPDAATRWTGAIQLWRSSSAATVAADRAGRRLSSTAIFGLLACALAALSIAGPRSVSPRALPAAVALVLDRSPSMFLPALDGNGTRIAAVVERARTWCDAQGIDGRARTWRAWVDGRVQSAVGARPPEAWLDPTGAGGERTWTNFDDATSLWLSDAGPGFDPLHAGVMLTGARVQPGAVALAAGSGSPGDRWWWSGVDGDPLERRAGPVSVVAADANLPSDLRELVEVWATARGWRAEALAPRANSEPDLTVLGVPTGPADRLVGTADAGAGPLPAQIGLPLAPAPGGVPLVAATFRAASPAAEAGGGAAALLWGPGKLWTPLVALDLRSGDSTAQALAWTGWLDRAAGWAGPGAAGQQVVALTERAERAEAGFRPPAAFGDGIQGRLPVSWAWVAGLGAAAAAALAAWSGRGFPAAGVRFGRSPGLR